MRGRARENPTIVFITLVLVSFILMTFDVQSSGEDDLISRFRAGAASLFGPVQAATDAVVDPVAEFVDGLVSIATLRQANEDLAAENEQLVAENASLRELAVENELLRRLLNLEDSIGVEVPTVLAEVQGTGDDGSLTVDQGREDGVLAGYPVLDEAGLLIGRVVAVADRQATVRLIPQSVDAIEVTTPSGLRGAVTGLGRPGELRLDVYEEAGPIPPDTLLSTAGTNGFPPGLQVALVTGAIEPIGDQITDARVEPVAEFGRIPRFVAVVQYQPTGVPAGDEPAEDDAETPPVEEGTEGEGATDDAATDETTP